MKTGAQRNRLIQLGKNFATNFECEKLDTLNSSTSILRDITIQLDEANYQLSFGQPNTEIKKPQAYEVVKTMDLNNISRDAYRSLTKIEPGLPKENLVASAKSEITILMNNAIPIKEFNMKDTLVDDDDSGDGDGDDENNEKDVTDNDIIATVKNFEGAGGYRNIINIINYLIPYYLKNNIINLIDNNLHIRISGDGRNVGRKIKHEMITFAFLNNSENIMKPDNHYTLVLYSGKEDYNSLLTSLSFLCRELSKLKENGYTDLENNHWNVHLYISGDWKFLATCLGFNMANSDSFCIWCSCTKSQLKNINASWKILIS